jgi:hypothetical protein
MGFSERHFYCIVAHDDESAVHIVASRVGLGGELRILKNENFINTEVIRELEQMFGLVVTSGACSLAARDAGPRSLILRRFKAPLTKFEVDLTRRTKRPSAKTLIQGLIDEFEGEGRSIADLVEYLRDAGVSSILNVSSVGELCGIGFKLGSAAFKGSELGRGYSANGLIQRGFSYERNRDSSRLSEFTTGCFWQDSPRNRTGHVARSMANEAVIADSCQLNQAVSLISPESVSSPEIDFETFSEQQWLNGRPAASNPQESFSPSAHSPLASDAVGEISRTHSFQLGASPAFGSHFETCESIADTPRLITNDVISYPKDGESVPATTTDSSLTAWIEQRLAEYGDSVDKGDCAQQCAEELLSLGYACSLEDLDEYSDAGPVVVEVFQRVIELVSERERERYGGEFGRG